MKGWNSKERVVVSVKIRAVKEICTYGAYSNGEIGSRYSLNPAKLQESFRVEVIQVDDKGIEHKFAEYKTKDDKDLMLIYDNLVKNKGNQKATEVIKEETIKLN